MANYLRNRAVRVRGTKKTPFELWFGHPPDMSKLQVPFSRVWFHKKTGDKLEPRAIKGVFIRYNSSRNHYVVMAKRDRKIYRVTNPIFLENKRGFISKEPGIRDLKEEPVFQRIFKVPAASSGTGGGIIIAPGANDASNGGGSTSTAGAGSAEGAGGTTSGENDVEGPTEVKNGNIDGSSQNSGPTNQNIEVVIPTYGQTSQETP